MHGVPVRTSSYAYSIRGMCRRLLRTAPSQARASAAIDGGARSADERRSSARMSDGIRMSHSGRTISSGSSRGQVPAGWPQVCPLASANTHACAPHSAL